jgi:hypothetical protein
LQPQKTIERGRLKRIFRGRNTIFANPYSVMEMENTPNISSPQTTAELLSAGRREFINRKNYMGLQMTAITSLFVAIARGLHGTGFQWSEYNRSQWEKFVSLSNEYGGSFAFSLEPDGEYRDEPAPFKGLYVGGPVGLHPYHISALVKKEYEGPIDEIISKCGYHHSR